ncbi:hypothetical protein ACP_1411 [Acidobacterium capsulatum ATCC 51196]|uniref:Uncharacterized protein n=1 Tax=Acidobacterium capsulatum (strain ATCC 51196 / DSM 11244 / BCRC 80197 / JCM 7670 / NBRC 15755 / NCIMB 13165 / 161) TaxID=240015 RepID=C1F602_ACIC5|nr:hypothetical protein ACP_1411 [Acidobacterium capsulatum ATCC 51196]
MLSNSLWFRDGLPCLRLNHPQAEWAELAQPSPGFVAAWELFADHPRAQQSQCESIACAGASGFQAEHLAIDFIAQLFNRRCGSGLALGWHEA